MGANTSRVRGERRTLAKLVARLGLDPGAGQLVAELWSSFRTAARESSSSAEGSPVFGPNFGDRSPYQVPSTIS